MQSQISSDIIRGHIDTILLKLLQEQEMYGYQIYKAILERSSGEYELKEPTMYSSLRRLESQGCITSRWGEETQGGRRRYYTITQAGRELYVKNRAEWEFARRIIDNLI
jgi:PadR family transcriptional regulator, regulatory protein PadR